MQTGLWGGGGGAPGVFWTGQELLLLDPAWGSHEVGVWACWGGGAWFPWGSVPPLDPHQGATLRMGGKWVPGECCPSPFPAGPLPCTPAQGSSQCPTESWRPDKETKVRDRPGWEAEGTLGAKGSPPISNGGEFTVCLLGWVNVRGTRSFHLFLSGELGRSEMDLSPQGCGSRKPASWRAPHPGEGPEPDFCWVSSPCSLSTVAFFLHRPPTLPRGHPSLWGQHLGNCPGEGVCVLQIGSQVSLLSSLSGSHL